MKNPILLYLVCLFLACQPQNKTTYYQEQHRPQFHFSPEKAWMNDPNGLVYEDGEYHLFYQHYPDSTVWGPMHWGHAISKDLIHWQHQPIALYPDSLGCIFSGSIVIDKNNTSGFQQGKQAPWAALFTYHNLDWEKAGRKDRESQGMAYSLDKGKTWTKYANNPIIKNKGDVDFRDPKVFWYEPTKSWIMPLAVADHLEFFSSTNLKDWQQVGEFGRKDGSHAGVWECPDLFQLTTPEGETHWVLLQSMGRGAVNGGSGTQYFVGDFDGKIFKNANPPEKTLWLDYGADNYAGVTWFNAPDNRRILLSWMSNWDDYAQSVPTSTWRSAMTVPRDLSLQKTTEGLRIVQQPVKEFEVLRTQEQTIPKQSVADFLKIDDSGIQKEIILDFDLAQSTATEFGLLLANTKNEKLLIGYDRTQKQFFIDRTQAGKKHFSDKFAKKHLAPYQAGEKLTLRVLIDNSAVEVFVDNGKLAMTEIFFPNEDYEQLGLYSKGGKTVLQSGKLFGLKSIWKP